MKLIRWRERDGGLDPFQSLENMQQEINKMFDNLAMPLPTGRDIQSFGPAVDITEDENQITVTADIPGMKKDDIDISVEDNILSLKGFKEEQKEEKGKNFIRTERFTGGFLRSFNLPSMVDSQKVNASYKDGILQITLPKKEEAKKKITKVNVQ